MKNIKIFIIHYISISIISVMLINIYCPMRQCLYSNSIKLSWLFLLCIPLIYSHDFFRSNIKKIITLFIILFSVYYYEIYSSIILLFITILFIGNTSSILNSIFSFITAFILSLITYVFYLLYIEGVFF